MTEVGGGWKLGGGRGGGEGTNGGGDGDDGCGDADNWGNDTKSFGGCILSMSVTSGSMQ